MLSLRMKMVKQLPLFWMPLKKNIQKNLKKKYAPNLQGVLDYLEQAKIELEELEQELHLTDALKEELDNLEFVYREVTEDLSSYRQRTARRLEEEVSRSMIDLEMGRVQCRVSFTKLDDVSPIGSERVEFLVAMNPGEPLRPLIKTASGGELSRIMLVLKALLAEADEVPVLVFDEVDAGVGGRALNAVAEKLMDISGFHQVICVTHAPQIAGYAKTHLLVSKEFDGERTFTRVEPLDHDRRVEELARMLDGKEITDISRQHAGQMLKRKRV